MYFYFSVDSLLLTAVTFLNNNISLKVRDIKKEAERQRMQREELEVELQKVRQQMSAVPSSGEAGSSVEDKRIDLTDSFRYA